MSRKRTADQLIGPLQIDALVNGGNGIAREQGRVIFVPGTFPGDIVRCRLRKEKKNFAEAGVVELLQASPLRREPLCPVADKCGGCQWQQLPYAEQLRWKQQLFADTLIRQAGVDPQLLRPIIPATDEWGYRSRAQLKCSHSAGRFIIGFYRSRSRSVVAIDQCPLLPPKLNQLLAELRTVLAASSHAAEIPQIDVAIGYDAATQAVVHYHGRDQTGLAGLLKPFAEQLCCALLIQSGREKKLCRVYGAGELQISVDQPELLLNYAAGGFAQINLEQNRQLVAAVLQAARLEGGERLLDLYCGMGNFSLPLARRAGTVCAVEDYAPSIEMARRNAAENGIRNVEFHVLPAEAALHKFSAAFDLLVMDPPRSGADAVVKQLARRPVARVIYISCNPQTLARDLKTLLTAGYRLLFSQTFDMFPQTFHIESLTVLEYRTD